ncbi:MAG TPA: AlpA family phage regulatory protein [Burkholderiaceae bacterium]|nr:AlpA family phage regulatory protein [Burkholderiaceae bacterium]
MSTEVTSSRQRRDVSPSPARFIKLPEVEARVAFDGATVYRRVKAGTFPPPVKVGKRASRWLEADVERWILDQAEQRA